MRIQGKHDCGERLILIGVYEPTAFFSGFLLQTARKKWGAAPYMEPPPWGATSSAAMPGSFEFMFSWPIRLVGKAHQISGRRIVEAKKLV